MRNDRYRVVVYLDKTLAAWLASKALEGYKKATLIRRALHIFRESKMQAQEYLKDLKNGDDCHSYNPDACN
ncbi:MAG: hypothetical protein ACREBF_04740 [Candidatus Micrarchaeales archaeon]